MTEKPGNGNCGEIANYILIGDKLMNGAGKDTIKRQNNKPAAMSLTTKIAGKEYVLGTLSFNVIKKEFSYHFSYPEDSPEKHLDCDTGQYTARLDHITWHQNVVHIKRGDGVPLERIKLTQGPLFCERPITTPLYVESLYFSNSEPCLRRMDHFKHWKGSQTQEVLDLDESNGFSIIYILAPSIMTTPELLLGMQFLEIPDGMDYPPCLLDLCSETHRPGRIKLWGNWDFIVLTSPYTCRIKSEIPKEVGNSYRLPNYKNVPAAVTDLLMQANNLMKGGKSTC